MSVVEPFLDVQIGDQITFISDGWSHSYYKIGDLFGLGLVGQTIEVLGFHKKATMSGVHYVLLRFVWKQQTFYVPPIPSVIEVYLPKLETISKSKYLAFDKKYNTSLIG